MMHYYIGYLDQEMKLMQMPILSLHSNVKWHETSAKCVKFGPPSTFAFIVGPN